MHATLVLLNWPFALWTGLGISQYPVISEEDKIYSATVQKNRLNKEHSSQILT